MGFPASLQKSSADSMHGKPTMATRSSEQVPTTSAVSGCHSRIPLPSARWKESICFAKQKWNANWYRPENLQFWRWLCRRLEHPNELPMVVQNKWGHRCRHKLRQRAPWCDGFWFQIFNNFLYDFEDSCLWPVHHMNHESAKKIPCEIVMIFVCLGIWLKRQILQREFPGEQDLIYYNVSQYVTMWFCWKINLHMGLGRKSKPITSITIHKHPQPSIAFQNHP